MHFIYLEENMFYFKQILNVNVDAKELDLNK